MNSPTSRSPIDRERHKPPGQHLKGPICQHISRKVNTMFIHEQIIHTETNR